MKCYCKKDTMNIGDYQVVSDELYSVTAVYYTRDVIGDMKIDYSESEIYIHQATIEDLDKLAHIFDEYRMFYGQQSNVEQAREFLFDRFEHSESVIFVAKVEGQEEIIGFTQLYPSFSSVSLKRSWILNDLYVMGSYRKLPVIVPLFVLQWCVKIGFPSHFLLNPHTVAYPSKG